MLDPSEGEQCADTRCRSSPSPGHVLRKNEGTFPRPSSPTHQVMGQRRQPEPEDPAPGGSTAHSWARRLSRGPQAKGHTHNGHPHTCSAMTRLPLAALLGPLRGPRHPRDTRPRPRAREANNGGSSSPGNTPQLSPLAKADCSGGGVGLGVAPGARREPENPRTGPLPAGPLPWGRGKDSSGPQPGGRPTPPGLASG